MNGGIFVDPTFDQGCMERPLYAGLTHGSGCLGRAAPIAKQGGE